MDNIKKGKKKDKVKSSLQQSSALTISSQTRVSELTCDMTIFYIK